MLFTVPPLEAVDDRVVEAIDDARQKISGYLGPQRRWMRPLRRTAFARNIQASNSIEGHNVSLDDALAAANDEEPFDADESDWLAVRNYGDAMTYVLGLADDDHFEHSATLIRSLHYMMMKHDLGAHPGRFRPGNVFVWSTSDGEVVYEGPPAEMVSSLVDELGGWLNDSLDDHLPMIRAAMAHLNLVMVHPFKDGNGRMARALQSLVLAREQIVAPEFASIEEYLGRNTPEYYRVLGEVGQGGWHPGNDARPWIRFVLTAHYRQALTTVRRVQDAERTWSSLSEELTNRHIDERNLVTLYQASLGRRIRRSDHVDSAEVSERVGSSDLKRLVDEGFLDPVGERRGRYYVASDRLRRIRAAALGARAPIGDPYGLFA